MTPQPQHSNLDRYEAYAQNRLTPLLGPLRTIDRPGAPPGQHDFDADRRVSCRPGNNQ
jgi:hypothetical protein